LAPDGMLRTKMATFFLMHIGSLSGRLHDTSIEGSPRTSVERQNNLIIYLYTAVGESNLNVYVIRFRTSMTYKAQDIDDPRICFMFRDTLIQRIKIRGYQIGTRT